MREVEIRVRELSRAPDSLIGKALMRKAFDVESGPLSDRELDPAERQGISDLFAGAIATFKNPVSHRQVDYGDAKEASEVVLFADLLLRILQKERRRRAPGSRPRARTTDVADALPALVGRVGHRRAHRRGAGAMLAVQWAMTAPKPVDRTMGFYSW